MKDGNRFAVAQQIERFVTEVSDRQESARSCCCVWCRAVPRPSSSSARRENFLHQGQLSVLTLISVSVSCYRSST